MSREKIFDRVKKVRVEKGLTQAQLAERANIGHTTLNLYERGHRVPDIDVMNRIAKALETDVAWLMTGEGPEKAEVKESTQPVAGGRGYDAGLLREVVRTVEDIFQTENLELPPEKKAELVGLLYEELLEDEAKKPELRGRVLKLMKLAS